MPYIRKDLRTLMEPDPVARATSPGALNFQFTRLAAVYIKEKGLSYVTINDVVGALESAKLEFYRRIAVPYEAQKILENGDVYES